MYRRSFPVAPGDDASPELTLPARDVLASGTAIVPYRAREPATAVIPAAVVPAEGRPRFRLRGSYKGARLRDPQGERPPGHVGRHRRGRRGGDSDTGTYTTLGPPVKAKPMKAGKRPNRRHRPLWQELPVLLLIAFALALLIKTFLVQAFFIPSGSMEETLQVRDRVLVNKVVYDYRDPRRGEIVVFRGTDSWAPESTVPPATNPVVKTGHWLGGLVGIAQPNEKDFIKRVIGLPGDTVRCCDSRGRVTVNGRPLDEPYVFENNPPDQRAFGPITVPAGRLFVMGDHRGLSQDSRAYIGDRWRGTVPIEQVIGRGFATVWPAGHWRPLQVPKTFQDVPSPSAIGRPSLVDGDVGAPGTVHAKRDVMLPVAPVLIALVHRRRRRPRRLRW